MKKRILLITGHFPPENSGGVGRPFSLYKYLPHNGFDVWVITKNIGRTSRNEKNVFRTESFINWRKSSFFSKKALNRYVTLPGFKLGLDFSDALWRKTAFEQACKIIEREKIDVIYATFPPGEAFQIAIQLKKKYSIPLVSEFRDGLLFEPIYPKRFLSDKLYKKTEQAIVANSEFIITIGKNLSNYFIKQYPDKKVFTVYNGYLKKEFQNINITNKPFNAIKIAHFGSFGYSKKRDTAPLYNALLQLQKEKLISSKNFELALIGRYKKSEKLEIDKLDLNDIVKFYPPFANKQKGYQFLTTNFNYFLVYGLEGDTTLIGSKVFDYMMLNKPVIGICKGNEVENIIKQTNIGLVSGFDMASIYNTIHVVIKNQLRFSPNAEQIKLFSREMQAMQIGQYISKIF